MRVCDVCRIAVGKLVGRLDQTKRKIGRGENGSAGANTYPCSITPSEFQMDDSPECLPSKKPPISDYVARIFDTYFGAGRDGSFSMPFPTAYRVGLCVSVVSLNSKVVPGHVRFQGDLSRANTSMRTERDGWVSPYSLLVQILGLQGSGRECRS